MLIRRSLVIVWLLLAQQTFQAQSARAQATPACGYPADSDAVAKMDGDVPVLFRPRALPTDAREKVHAHRTRLLDREQRDSARCPETESYLRRILDRLVRSSRLERFARRAPAVTLVVQCRPGVPLPVARASAGGVILVPRALPELAGSEDAIAAVLAHELAHLTLRHAERFIEALRASPSTPEAQGALRSAHEREADVTGLRLLVNAGYNPRAAIGHLRSVQELAAQVRPRRVERQRRGRAVHEEVEQRVARLDEQIRGCRYHRTLSADVPVSSEVRAELSRPVRFERSVAQSGDLSSPWTREHLLRRPAH